MALGLANKRVSSIAVDFGTDSLKLLQVLPSEPPQLVAAATITVPQEVRLNVDARHAFLTEALRKLLRSHKFKGRKAICSIPSYQTLVQHLEIARLEHENFDAQVGLHLRQRLNVDPSRMIIRHFQVGQVVRDGTPKQVVICLAASRESVMRYIETAHRAKLDVVGMHSEPLAILRAFGHLFRGEAGRQQTTCFIDLGASTTKVVISHGDQMVFAKTIHAAGDHLTRHRAARDRINFWEARRIRIAEAAAGSSNRAAAPQTNPPPADAPDGGGLAVLDAPIAGGQQTITATAPTIAVTAADTSDDGDDKDDTIDCIIDELQMSVRHHQSLFPNRPIQKLVFLGGESHHVAMCQRIAQSLRIGAQLGDPLARMVRLNQSGKSSGVDMRQPQPSWAVPMGLCLSEANLK